MVSKYLRFEELGTSCPTQWDVFDPDGKQVYYIRYRWGYLSVELVEGDDWEEIWGKQIGDPYDGFLSTIDMLAELDGVL